MLSSDLLLLHWYILSSVHTLYLIIAGGIGTYLHADYVKTLLPESASYHAMADAG